MFKSNIETVGQHGEFTKKIKFVRCLCVTRKYVSVRINILMLFEDILNDRHSTKIQRSALQILRFIEIYKTANVEFRDTLLAYFELLLLLIVTMLAQLIMLLNKEYAPTDNFPIVFTNHSFRTNISCNLTSAMRNLQATILLYSKILRLVQTSRDLTNNLVTCRTSTLKLSPPLTTSQLNL